MRKILLMSLFIAIYCYPMYAEDCLGKAYDIVIKVVDGVDSCLSKGMPAGQWRCPTLYHALKMHKKRSLSNGCIVVLKDNDSFVESIDLVNVHNLKITSNSSQATLNCLDKESGISFSNSNGISISNLLFSMCGSLTSTVVRDRKPVHLTTVLYFERSMNIRLIDISLEDFRGYGIVFTDCAKEIYLRGVNANLNRPWTFYDTNKPNEIFAYGGGVMFQHISKQIIEPTQFLSEDCTFARLRATNLTKHVDKYHSLKPAGYGGGVSIFLSSTRGNTFYLSVLNIYQCTAFYGGGLYLEHTSSSHDNSIEISVPIISSNIAIMSGGGFEYFMDRYPHENNNTLVLEYGRLINNTATTLFGGGFSCRKRQSDDPNHGSFYPSLIKTFLRSLQEVQENNAKLGSAFFFEDAHASIESSYLFSNNAENLPKDEAGLAVIYAYKSNILVKDVTVSNNALTAMLMDFSVLRVYGLLHIEKNIGLNGGGIALFAESQIDIRQDEALVRIKDCKANRGGGLYVHYSSPFVSGIGPNTLDIYDCFFIVNTKEEKSPKVFFDGNLAIEGEGNDIFATSLNPCSDINNIEQLFNFSTKDSITTEPSQINIPTNVPMWDNLYPGKKFTVPIYLIDETNHFVSGIIQIKVKSSSNSVGLLNEQSEYVVKNNETHITLEASKRDVKFDLVFSTNNGREKIVSAYFDYCPFGKTFHEKSKSCVCDTKKNARRGIAECRGDDIYVFSNLWFNYNLDSIRNDDEKFLQCPKDYCRPCTDKERGENKVVCKFSKTNQCHKSRDQNSVLCSDCKNGTSLKWGSENCSNCKTTKLKFWIYMVLIFFGSGVVIAILLLCNIDIYALYGNSVIFFYQTVELLFTITQKTDPAMKVFLNMINFNGFGGYSAFCVPYDLTDLYKSIPNLALLMVLVIFLTFFLCTSVVEWILSKFKLFRFLTFGISVEKFLEERNYRIIVLFILFFYGSMTRIVFSALYPIKSKDIGTRFYTYAEATYGDHKAIVTIVLVINGLAACIIILLPLLFIFDVCWKRCYPKVFRKIRSVRNMFTAPFREDTLSQLFAVYFLVWRFLLSLVSMLMTSLRPSKQQTLSLLTSMTVLILFLFTLQKPYKSYYGNEFKYLNTFDTFILFLLCLVGVISNAKLKVSALDPVNESLESVVMILIWIPITLVVGRLLIRLILLGRWIYGKRNNQRTFFAVCKKYFSEGCHRFEE